MDRDPRSGPKIVVGKKCARELPCTFGILAFHAERPIEARRQEECRLGRGGADAAEPTSERPAQIEHSEMEPRRRLDEHGVKPVGPGHGAAGSGRADRM